MKLIKKSASTGPVAPVSEAASGSGRTIDRRTFLKRSGVTAGGLAVRELARDVELDLVALAGSDEPVVPSLDDVARPERDDERYDPESSDD